MQQADTTLRTSAAYLYFVHIKDIGDQVDAKHLKLLHQKDSSKSYTEINVHTIFACCEYEATPSATA